jgi:hypothetical protein
VLILQLENQRIVLEEKFILILSRLKRLVVTSVKVLCARFVHWTKSLTSSLSLGTLSDLARSRPELVAENALCWLLRISVLKQSSTQHHEQLSRHLPNGKMERLRI